MLTRKGSRRLALCRLSTFEDMVALKRNVRLSLGRNLSSLSRIGPKSISSSRSASSMTKYLVFDSLKPFVFSRWSSRRPGVATTIWGFLDRAMDWGIMSKPPTMTVDRTDMEAPRASTAWPICDASSRVGASIRPKKGEGFSRSAWRIGNTKAAVFPLPVSARPIRSLFWRARGMDCAWMGVGFLYPSARHASTRGSTIPYKAQSH